MGIPGLRFVEGKEPETRKPIKAHKVSVSVIQLPDGQLKVWGCSFTIEGEIGGDGRVMTHHKLDEASRKRIEKELAKFLESLEFPAVGL